jgi:hypothetical protein
MRVPNLLTTASVMTCPHGGTVTATTSNTQAKANGAYLLRASDLFTIAGCAFNVVLPHPCVQVKWVVPAQQSKASGDFTLTEASVGQCVAADQAVQGLVLIQSTQPKVAGR